MDAVGPLCEKKHYDYDFTYEMRSIRGVRRRPVDYGGRVIPHVAMQMIDFVGQRFRGLHRHGIRVIRRCRANEAFQPKFIRAERNQILYLDERQSPSQSVHARPEFEVPRRRYSILQLVDRLESVCTPACRSPRRPDQASVDIDSR